MSNIKEVLLPADLQKSIDNIVRNEGYISFKLHKKQISTNGGNFLGVLYEVDVKGNSVNGDKETNIFVKEIIPGALITVMSVNEAYVKEAYAYNELFKIFTELQNEANVPLEERFKTAKSYDETGEKAIFLENLTRKGFQTGHRMDPISLDYAELCIKQLAKFHGLSYVIREKRPEYFNSKLRIMKYPFDFNEDFYKTTMNMCEKSSQPLNSDLKTKVKNFVSTMPERYPAYWNDTTSVGCCLCHADYRINNILMKKTDGKVTEVIPVDYQLLYYGCPMNDILYFIFLGTDQQFRRKHMNDLKNLYYDTLDSFLSKYFSLDVESLYPRVEFEKQFKEKLDYGLMVALFALPFIFVSEKDVPEFSKDELSTLDFDIDSNFEERIKGVVEDFVHWGVL